MARDEWQVIISFMPNLIARHDVTFSLSQTHVCAVPVVLRHQYLWSQHLSVLSLLLSVARHLYSECVVNKWTGGERFSTFIAKGAFSLSRAEPSALLNYKLSRLSSLNHMISHISIRCIVEYNYLNYSHNLHL